ncbi:hypothetical protein HYW20_02395 [Candidatus Woesearchaeota archaeon]|nr:hypothetical protein [Candidatus Woesearchaeota archaeon]
MNLVKLEYDNGVFTRDGKAVQVVAIGEPVAMFRTPNGFLLEHLVEKNIPTDANAFTVRETTSQTFEGEWETDRLKHIETLYAVAIQYFRI